MFEGSYAPSPTTLTVEGPGFLRAGCGVSIDLELRAEPFKASVCFRVLAFCQGPTSALAVVVH